MFMHSYCYCCFMPFQHKTDLPHDVYHYFCASVRKDGAA